jgi:arabinose-5-phosphate isomerase
MTTSALNPSPAPSSQIREIARTVLQTQAEALSLIADQLTETFDDAVSAIVAVNSREKRVITSGMGKAGHIAQKFSATLASTGVSSFFVSPSEALHGDLGRFSAGDLAIFFSFSGESEEVLALVPRVKERSCRIISITQSENSSLGEASDIVVALGPVPECPPIKIAPTTSTTVMLAVSDALAMGCCSLRGFERADFAKLHPAGDIGRRLVKIAEIMRTGDFHCVVSDSLPVREVIGKYVKTPGRPGAASIVDRLGKLVGVFTDGDLRRLLGEGSDFLDAPVGSIIGRKPKSIPESASAREALELIGRLQVDQLVVIGANDVPVGMVDIQDLAGFLQNAPSRGKV